MKTGKDRGLMNLDDLLSTLDARVQAFAVCKVGNSVALCQPEMDAPLIHYVLKGEGWISGNDHYDPLRAGSLAIIPKGMPHRLSVKRQGGRDVKGMETCIALSGGLIQMGEDTDVGLISTARR